MPTAKKLPSGSWRCQVYSHTEKTWDNNTKSWKIKKIYESFTSDDPSPRGKRKAELMAAQFAAGKEGKKRSEHLSVTTAVEKYIELKRAVLSPSTIRGYESLLHNAYNQIEGIDIHKIDNTTIQLWISNYSSEHSPKTTRNAHALLQASISTFRPDFVENTQLPAKQRPDLYIPTDDDIKNLLRHVSGKELEIAILLAAFGPMRRSEICALDASDIHGNIVTVKKSMVRTPDDTWKIKQPKTYAGYRNIPYPQFVIDKLSGIEGRIVKGNPDVISNRFRRAVRSSGLPHFRFHDLRHYAASIMHAIGVPDVYIIERGGWSTDNVMKTIYRHSLSDQTQKMNDTANSYFTDLMK